MEYTNEAFWFFYWVSFFSRLTIVLTIAGVFGIIVTIVSATVWGEQDDEVGAKILLWGIIASIGLFTSALFVPPKAAFYAGVAQEIAETDEVTETLRNLKTVIDKKLEELGAE